MKKPIKKHRHKWTHDPQNNRYICFKCGIVKTEKQLTEAAKVRLEGRS